MLNWFKRTPKADETRGQLADPQDWLLELFGAAPGLSGIAVSPATALRCPPARCAIQAISEAIGQLPLIVYRRNGEARERAPEHPAYRLLHDQFNEWTPASEAKEQITRDALLTGNGYLFLNRAGGQLRELLRIEPTAISVEQDAQSGEPVYRHSPTSGTGRIIPRQDLIHIRAPGTNGVSGRSPVLDCKEAIALAILLESHGNQFFGKGGRPDGILSTDAKLGADAITRMGKVWKAAFGGGRSGGTPLLDQGLKYQQLSFSSVDSQYLELRQFCVNEIARVFRVPPHMLYELGRATWGNASEMGRSWLTFGLMAWIRKWEGEINLKLFGGDREHYAEFLLDSLVRPDLAARAEAYSKMISARVLNPNEARAKENLPPYDGGEEFINPNTTAQPAVGQS